MSDIELYSGIPASWRAADILDDVSADSPLQEPYRRYLQVFEALFELVKNKADGLRNWISVFDAPPKALRLMSLNLGIENLDLLDMTVELERNMRNIVLNAVYIFQRKGTLNALKYMMAKLCGWTCPPCRVYEYLPFRSFIVSTTKSTASIYHGSEWNELLGVFPPEVQKTVFIWDVEADDWLERDWYDLLAFNVDDTESYPGTATDLGNISWLEDDGHGILYIEIHNDPDVVAASSEGEDSGYAGQFNYGDDYEKVYVTGDDATDLLNKYIYLEGDIFWYAQKVINAVFDGFDTELTLENGYLGTLGLGAIWVAETMVGNDVENPKQKLWMLKEIVKRYVPVGVHIQITHDVPDILTPINIEN